MPSHSTAVKSPAAAGGKRQEKMRGLRTLPAAMIRALLGAGMVAGFLFAGCAHTLPQEPTFLPFPERPGLDWHLCYSAPSVAEPDRMCLTFEDTDRLLKWDDQLRAFEAARQRLRDDQPVRSPDRPARP
jgi:hypothetical protein